MFIYKKLKRIISKLLRGKCKKKTTMIQMRQWSRTNENRKSEVKKKAQIKMVEIKYINGYKQCIWTVFSN